MQRAMAIGLLVHAAPLAGVLLKLAEVVLHVAGGGGGAPAGNGDVNGDAKIDISDGGSYGANGGLVRVSLLRRTRPGSDSRAPLSRSR